LANTPRINPRDRKPGDRRPLTPPRPAFSIWWVLGMLLLLALAQAWFLAPAGTPIPYSEFKSLVRRGQVVEVTVGEQTITGTLKQPRGEGRRASTAFTTTRIEDPKLVEELEAHGVKFTGEIVSRWLPEIIGAPLAWRLLTRVTADAATEHATTGREPAQTQAEPPGRVSHGMYRRL